MVRFIHFERFVSVVRRRLILVRVLERAGACAAVGCAVAAVWTGAAIGMGRGGLPLSIGAIALGFAVGIAWGLARRPTLLSAAAYADRHFELKDLLSTATAARHAAEDDEWSRTILALADARCRSLAPAEVVLSRYGLRAWGGLGLAVAFVLMLGILSAAPLRTDANSLAEAAARADEIGALPAAQNAPAPRSDIARSAPQPRASDRRGASLREANSISSSTQSTHSGNAASDSGPGENGPSNGSGARSATEGENSPMPPASPGGGAPRVSAAEGDETGGGGNAATASLAAGADGSAGGVSRGEARLSNSTPWHSAGWNQHRAAALQAAEDGRVPDQYRDVMRDYFSGIDGRSP
jgi:hypothetical protein